MRNAGRHYCNNACRLSHRLRRPQATPFRVTASDHAKDAAEVVLGVVILLILLIGLPLDLWLIAGGIR